MHWQTAKGPTGASTVSMTPAMHCRCRWHRRRHASPVSLTPVKLAIFTVRYQWHRWCMTSPVSMTLVTCFAGVIDTGKYMLRRCHWHRRMHAFPANLLTATQQKKKVWDGEQIVVFHLASSLYITLSPKIQHAIYVKNISCNILWLKFFMCWCSKRKWTCYLYIQYSGRHRSVEVSRRYFKKSKTVKALILKRYRFFLPFKRWYING